ncbi:MAG: hypothetical protein M3033_00675 [Acidobacteriota bacterium]|nr:hypothetical protein [Acidobacteriota bacterium]
MLHNTSNKSADGFGTVLLQCRWRRVLSIVIVVGSVAITFSFSYVFFNETSWTLKLLVAVVILLGLVGIMNGIRNIINPQLLFEVTSRGILMYVEGNISLSPPFFIPWERVESMKYEVRTTFDVGHRHTIKVVALKVRTDETWSPVGCLKWNYEQLTGYIYLDAFTGAPHDTDLFHQVEKIKAQYSPMTS